MSEEAVTPYGINISAYLRAMIEAQTKMMSLYPMTEHDVDANVYVALSEERRFERGEMLVSDFIEELRAIAAEAPDGCSAVIEFERDCGWDDDDITVCKAGYWREPTQEEREEREAHNAKAREHNANLATIRIAETEAAEKAEFVRLSAKFSPDRNPKGRDGTARCEA